MAQLELFQEIQSSKLETFIEREGDLLAIPEGLHTIPCTHGLHRFAGKFIPNLPRYLIREILPNLALLLTALELLQACSLPFPLQADNLFLQKQSS